MRVKQVLNLHNPQNKKKIVPSPTKLLQVNQMKKKWQLIRMKNPIVWWIQNLEIFMKMINKSRFLRINTASTMKILKNSEKQFLRSLLLSKDLTKLVLAQVAFKMMKSISSLKLKKATWARMITTWKSLIFSVSLCQLKNKRKWNKIKKQATRSKRGERLSMISSTSSRKLIISLKFKKVVVCKTLTHQRASSNTRSTPTMPHSWMTCNTQPLSTKTDLSCVPRLSLMPTRHKLLKLTKKLLPPETEN